MIRNIIHNCVICFKTNPRNASHIMGDLPSVRVNSVRPFLNSGVDYFGPLYIRESRRRNSKTTKTYGVIFICLATKSVHLELATDLSSEVYIAAMKRFMARRGKPAHIYADNATNFVGANKELRALRDIFINKESRQKIMSSMSENGIEWHFIPPRAPHFGGIWEAAVKSTKYHIRRVLGNSSLTYEEMNTVLTQIEAILNSRPLTPFSNDPNDLSFLTPGHFLIGDSLTTNTEPNLGEIKLNRLSRWQLVERLRQHFWSRWSKEYLSQLQQRSRWKSQSIKSIQPGQLVIIRIDNTPPLQWPMGRVIDLHPGHDGVPRVATIHTVSGPIKRPVIRLCPLPIEQNDIEESDKEEIVISNAL